MWSCVCLHKVLYVNIEKGNWCVLYIVPKEHDILCAAPLTPPPPLPLYFCMGAGKGDPCCRDKKTILEYRIRLTLARDRILIVSMDTEKVLFKLKSWPFGAKRLLFRWKSNFLAHTTSLRIPVLAWLRTECNPNSDRSYKLFPRTTLLCS